MCRYQRRLYLIYSAKIYMKPDLLKILYFCIDIAVWKPVWLKIVEILFYKSINQSIAHSNRSIWSRTEQIIHPKLKSQSPFSHCI